jgi:hypothetical protein
VTKKLVGDCSGRRMAGEVFLTVTRGDGSWLLPRRRCFGIQGSKRLDKRVHELS